MKTTMVNALLKAIETSELQKENTVRISREDAEEIVRLLGGKKNEPWTPVGADGRVQFYCAECAKSFRAEPREDAECYEKWHYHTWYANCPDCRREVSQTDRYWR